MEEVHDIVKDSERQKMKLCNSLDIVTSLGLPFSCFLYVDHIKIAW